MRISLAPALLAASAVALALSHSAEIHARATAALGEGMPAREAALARGFVLGEDEGIDGRTTEDFRRSGLSHLLAVSGQNVALLALLALPLLAALGMPLRTRLVWLLGLIAVYVPLAGAGPSIVRAGIMGGLSVLATLVGRRASPFYALVLAAVLMLAVAPRIATDVGWQLSFAAVLGILAFATPLCRLIAARAGAGGPLRPLVDGAAMTIGAGVTTAPLIALHFESISLLTLPANLLALPAVAPAMWLGMLAASAGQVPGLPVEALNQVNALLLAYIAQVAAWCGRPSWACPEVRIGATGMIVAYVAIALVALALRRISADGPRRGLRVRSATRRRILLGVPAVLAVVVLAWRSGSAAPPDPPRGLRVSVLDVGQGDAILLQPRAAPAVLVDGGPPGAGLGAMLREAGVDALGAVVLSHDQTDHAGGVRELLGAMPIGRLLYAVPGPTVAAARAAGVPASRLARGGELRLGELRLEALWPPHELLANVDAGADPNRLAIVLRACRRRFSMLLTGDAEAEAVPLDPGPVDVLKLAHHGSEDAGLGELLEASRPRLAVISVGSENPFGHPAPVTSATLARQGVRTLRTDRDGTVVLDVVGDVFRVSDGG